MAAFEAFLRGYWCISCICIILCSTGTNGDDCIIPTQFRGDFFSMERGDDVDTLINDKRLYNKFFAGNCLASWHDNSTLDANGNHDSKLLFREDVAKCYQCYYMRYRTPNVVQYQQSECTTKSSPPTLDEICDDIKEFTDMYTFFRKSLETVNCKNTFEGVYHFTYEWDEGGGGICDSEQSQIEACQEPGSPYLDNQVFFMKFGKCPDVSTSVNQQIRFQCMGTWEDSTGNIWSGLTDLGADVPRERYRCMLTRYDQEESDNKQRYTMSWWADCSSLNSPYEGPVRLLLTPIIGGFQLSYTQAQCNFPTNYSGHWYHTSEFDVDVDINQTHIYFKSNIDLYSYKESYFTCMMTSGTRFLTVAITIGKCEIDYVCFDMLPRHHSVIRWRMGKPYRLTEVEMAYPDFKMYMFRQACTWSSFTLDREDYHWNYKTFLLNPPVPIPCPIRGRYFFTQKGPESELYRTRIRGITVRPRHMIDCRQYVTEIKACDENPSKLLIDAEYCETVDHTGRPVGEYDEADWELTCIGHWDEDWNRYLITWDEEDATSPYRCWNYERVDWRHILMSRANKAACLPTQNSRTHDPKLGGSLALEMRENERLFDDCAQTYVDGDPWNSPVNVDRVSFSGCTSSGEIDYVCFDMLPRHHSIVRWRMGKPYRLTEVEMAYPDFKMYMFRQACTWSSFTLDRDEFHWNYKTFLLNPPVPIPCPIRGRYLFTQKGQETELFRTRIRGITVRPRHMIDCREYVTEIKACDENPSKLMVDAEYCETVDHTGRPVGEYDEADWEMTCIGHWDEDWNSYLITWDEEDATSAFRCWNYERLDWRHILMSRSTSAACPPSQSSRSYDPNEGGSLALAMTENERLFDDCAQTFIDGDPWLSPVNIDKLQFLSDSSSSGSRSLGTLYACAMYIVFTWNL